ncbi:MAG: KEOPS complex kinase/ATPase Bud32 [Candidatus Woesearchaeota archaeon]
MQEELARGAEAIIIRDGSEVIKKRISKGYRIKEIDESLRNFRTRREAKIISKIPKFAPKILECDNRETIRMSFIDGKKVRDVLDKKPELCTEIGRKLALLHSRSIIHGDLTTANMILNKEIFFIDFGLSFISHKTEDKAVDIHLFMQALEGKHFRVYEKARKFFFGGYKNAEDYDAVVERLEAVEKRGRNKAKF